MNFGRLRDMLEMRGEQPRLRQGPNVFGGRLLWLPAAGSRNPRVQLSFFQRVRSPSFNTHPFGRQGLRPGSAPPLQSHHGS